MDDIISPDFFPSKRIPHSQRPCIKCGNTPRVSGKCWCRVCHNEYHRNRRKGKVARDQWLKQKYNLTPEDYELMLFQQGGVCAICGKAETAMDGYTGKPKVLSIDHNHETGQVRELLCQKCNFLLGFIEQDYDRVKKLVKYLKKHDR